MATIACTGGDFCALAAPKRVKLKIAGKPYWAKVIAPTTIDAGSERPIKVRLSKPTLEKLGRKTANGRLQISIRSQIGAIRQTIAVRIKKATGRPNAQISLS